MAQAWVLAACVALLGSLGSIAAQEAAQARLLAAGM